MRLLDIFAIGLRNHRECDGLCGDAGECACAAGLTWIMKPCGRAQGRGIFLIDRMSQARPHTQNMPQLALRSRVVLTRSILHTWIPPRSAELPISCITAAKVATWQRLQGDEVESNETALRAVARPATAFSI